MIGIIANHCLFTKPKPTKKLKGTVSELCASAHPAQWRLAYSQIKTATHHAATLLVTPSLALFITAHSRSADHGAPRAELCSVQEQQDHHKDTGDILDSAHCCAFGYFGVSIVQWVLGRIYTCSVRSLEVKYCGKAIYPALFTSHNQHTSLLNELSQVSRIPHPFDPTHTLQPRWATAYNAHSAKSRLCGRSR